MGLFKKVKKLQNPEYRKVSDQGQVISEEQIKQQIAVDLANAPQKEEVVPQEKDYKDILVDHLSKLSNLQQELIGALRNG